MFDDGGEVRTRGSYHTATLWCIGNESFIVEGSELEQIMPLSLAQT